MQRNLEVVDVSSAEDEEGGTKDDEEIGLLLKNRMVRALKLLSLRYLRYLSWKAKDAR